MKSKINMKYNEGDWYWKVSIGTILGLGGTINTGRNTDYCVAYQQAFNCILDTEVKGYPKHNIMRGVLFGVGTISSIVTYFGWMT